MENNTLINDSINFPSVRLISETGEQLGVMPSRAALRIAGERELDLVCVSPNAPIPVCKLMDYGRFAFEQQKKAREAKKKQVIIKTSEIQFSYTTQEHDLLTKVKTAKRLIEEKNSIIRIVLRLRGREVAYEDLAKEKVQHFVELCSEFAKVKKDLFVEGRDIKVVIEKK